MWKRVWIQPREKKEKKTNKTTFRQTCLWFIDDNWMESEVWTCLDQVVSHWKFRKANSRCSFMAIKYILAPTKKNEVQKAKLSKTFAKF